MDCDLLQDDIGALVDGELDDETRSTVEAHLSSCPACEAEFVEMRAVKALVGRMKLHEIDPPDTLKVFPDASDESAPATTSVAFWRRPLPSHIVGVAAAAVLVALGLGWHFTVSGYTSAAYANDAVVAHLSGIASVVPPDQVGQGQISLQSERVGQDYILHAGIARVGDKNAQQTVYAIGGLLVSELRFEPGDFDDRQMTRMTAGPRSYQVATHGDFSIVSSTDDHEQVVLVAACPPEVLISLAQKIPTATTLNTGGVGY